MGFLQQIKNEAKKEREVPYMYRKYDIFEFYNAIGSGAGNPLSRIRNALGLALNEHMDRLPKYVICFLDEKLIQLVETKFDAELLIDWIFKEYYRSIAIRKDDLDDKAVDPCAPRFVMVKGIARSKLIDTHRVYKSRRHIFNKVLNQKSSKFSKRGKTTSGFLTQQRKSHCSMILKSTHQS